VEAELLDNKPRGRRYLAEINTPPLSKYEGLRSGPRVIGVSIKTIESATALSYVFLGPVGTFTELALDQVKEAKTAKKISVNHVAEAIELVILGKAKRAIIPVENSIEGGVSATLDALAGTDKVRIYGEYLVPVSFNLVARPGTKLSDVKTIATHPVAYAQSRKWLLEKLPKHVHLPATSTAAAAAALLSSEQADAAIAAPTITNHHKLITLAKSIGENKQAQTRFIQIGLAGDLSKPTGADKTSVIVELPSDQPGSLLAMLEQFSTRGVNLTRIESRPIGDRLGRYRFNIDAEGHVLDESMGEALAGLHRFSPKVSFLGSYSRADKQQTKPEGNNSNGQYADAKKWLEGIRRAK
jgi:prephenate dehydratase